MPRLTPQHWKVLECILIELGYTLARHNGTSHRIYHRAGNLRPFTLPTYKDVGVLIISNLIKNAGITRAEYKRLLKSCRKKA